MTHYKSLVDTSFLGQWDFPPGREAVVTISKVERYKPEQRRRKRQPDGSYVDEPCKRLAISFEGKRKPWLAGPVSLQAIAKMYGPNIEGWVGKAITLYVDAKVEFGGVVTGGVRVRPTPPRAGTRPTEDTLDRPVDEEKAQTIDNAAGRREPGED